MDLRQLRYFSAVVEEGSVTGAARRLQMTQPPLTTQLHALEAELDCRLFTHEGRRLHLTEAGQTLYARARTILGLCDAAQEEMAGFQAGTAGTLRLGVVSSVRGPLLQGWLQRYAAQYPAVRYDICGDNTYQQLAHIQEGQRDLAVVRTPFSAASLTVLPLRHESMLAVGGDNWFAADVGTITLDALSMLPLIVYRRWQDVLRARLETVGRAPQLRCCCDDAQTTLNLALGGLGVGLIPASAAPAERPAGVRFCTVADEGLTTDIVAVCRTPALLAQNARLFWEMLAGESLQKEKIRLSGPANGPQSPLHK